MQRNCATRWQSTRWKSEELGICTLFIMLFCWRTISRHVRNMLVRWRILFESQIECINFRTWSDNFKKDRPRRDYLIHYLCLMHVDTELKCAISIIFLSNKDDPRTSVLFISLASKTSVKKILHFRPSKSMYHFVNIVSEPKELNQILVRVWVPKMPNFAFVNQTSAFLHISEPKQFLFIDHALVIKSAMKLFLPLF